MPGTANELKKKEMAKEDNCSVPQSTQNKIQDVVPDGGKQKTGIRKNKKSQKKTPQEVVFTNRSISNLSRQLGPNDWIRLAYALGFVPQGIAHFTGRASSAQNSYSQCTFMLRTWRSLTCHREILSRLCDALQKIRRHDLAVKIGLEIAIHATETADKNELTLLPELLKLIRENNDTLVPPYNQSKVVFPDEKVSFLARQLLAREEWKRLAYALGFLPDDASQIIASASSSQNLYTQAHMMLLKWRHQTPANRIVESLRASFKRIRRHDLVFLLDLGAITSPFDKSQETFEEKLRKLEQETKTKPPSFGADIVAKFRDLQF